MHDTFKQAPLDTPVDSNCCAPAYAALGTCFRLAARSRVQFRTTKKITSPESSNKWIQYIALLHVDSLGG